MNVFWQKLVSLTKDVMTSWSPVECVENLDNNKNRERHRPRLWTVKQLTVNVSEFLRFSLTLHEVRLYTATYSNTDTSTFLHTNTQSYTGPNHAGNGKNLWYLNTQNIQIFMDNILTRKYMLTTCTVIA